MKKRRLALYLSAIILVFLAIAAAVLLMKGTQPSSKNSQAMTTSHQEKRSIKSDNSTSSSGSTLSESSQVSQENRQSSSAPQQSGSTMDSRPESNDHANLKSRDQQVTISATEIRSTRGILRNAGIDDSKFTDQEIEDLMNQSIQTGKPIPDLARK